jgi:hypothetical protein
LSKTVKIIKGVSTGFLVSVFFGFFPTFIFAIFIYWLDRYEKEPKILLGAVYSWGAIVAAGMACAINTFFEGAFIVFYRYSNRC